MNGRFGKNAVQNLCRPLCYNGHSTAVKYLLRLIPVALLATIILLFSLTGALIPSHRSQFSVPLTHAPPTSQRSSREVSHTQVARTRAVLANMSTLFERNQGQFAGEAEFVAHSGTSTLALSSEGATLRLPSSCAPSATRPGKVRALRMSLIGVKSHRRPSGQKRLGTRVNYFVGKDLSNWQRDIEMVGQVCYKGVYPGTDLVYYGRDGLLEYDFLLAPGADPNRIRMNFAGADTFALHNLCLHMPSVTSL